MPPCDGVESFVIQVSGCTNLMLFHCDSDVVKVHLIHLVGVRECHMKVIVWK